MLLDYNSKKWLAEFFKDNVRFDELMSKHTSLRVGGSVEAYIEPENLEKLVALIKWLKQKAIPYLIVGSGTNLLVKDNGINGIVIVLKKCFKRIIQTNLQQSEVVVDAGVGMQTFCMFAVEHGLGGMNFAIGIPGTVGGGIAMNAGTALGSVSDVINAVTLLLPTGEIKTMTKKKLKFDYRKFSCDNNQIILNGSFRLYQADCNELNESARAILKKRKETQPINFANAGCIFKNPSRGRAAGELIEQAKLKGKTIGGAQISSKHANFIINIGRASASDIIALIQFAQKTVQDKFNINLETEVKIIGSET